MDPDDRPAAPAAPAAPRAPVPAAPPLPRGDLRRAVLRLRATSARDGFPSRLLLGVPGGTVVGLVLPTPVPRPLPAGVATDHALRTDVVRALLDRWERSAPAGLAPPVLQLARSGSLELHDADLAWAAAGEAAYGSAGMVARTVVLTRQGWYAPRTDERQVWRRLRDRTGRALD